MPLKDPKVAIRDLLVANWDTANTILDSVPSIHTGWFNGQRLNTPQVTVTDPNENILDGGNTGFSAIGGGSTGGRVKFIIGNLTVGTWAHQRMIDGVNAKALSFDLSEEVRRIINVHIHDAEDMEWVSWDGRSERINPTEDPVLFRYDTLVTYFRIDRVT